MHTPPLETVTQRNTYLEMISRTGQEAPPGHTQSVSLHLNVSARTGSVSCIIIVKDDDDDNSAYESLRRALDHESMYDFIRICPPHLLNILCCQLDALCEDYWNSRKKEYERAWDCMIRLCQRPKALYKDHGRRIYRIIHKLNIIHLALKPLDDATTYELMALKFTRKMMATFKGKVNRPAPSRAQSEHFRQVNDGLETTAQRRQARRGMIDKLAEGSVEIVSEQSYESCCLLPDLVEKVDTDQVPASQHQRRTRHPDQP